MHKTQAKIHDTLQNDMRKNYTQINDTQHNGMKKNDTQQKDADPECQVAYFHLAELNFSE
jgi:hypothetical protein